MKKFYTLGEHITAADPRGLFKITSRNIAIEILESLQKLKEIKLFDSKEKTQKFAEINAKRDKDHKVISISPCIEIFIIDESVIQKNNASNEYFIAPNQIINIIIQNATVNIPAAIGEQEYTINGKSKKILDLQNYSYSGDAASEDLCSELRNEVTIISNAIADYFNGYVQMGIKHGVPKKELENPAVYALITAASAIFTTDYQDWSAIIAKNLMSNSQWEIDKIHNYLLEWRQKFFQQTKDYTKSIFLKKLDAALITLHEVSLKNKFDDFDNEKFLSDQLKKDIAETPNMTDVASSVAPAAAAADISGTITFAMTDAPFRMFTPVIPKEEKPKEENLVDQNTALEELFKKAKENPELGKYLLDKAKEFDITPKNVPTF